LRLCRIHVLIGKARPRRFGAGAYCAIPLRCVYWNSFIIWFYILAYYFGLLILFITLHIIDLLYYIGLLLYWTCPEGAATWE
jgi:hypothetical protein